MVTIHSGSVANCVPCTQYTVMVPWVLMVGLLLLLMHRVVGSSHGLNLQ